MGHVHTRPVNWSEQLRKRGLRTTQPRLATLRYLEQHPHSGAETIHAGIAQHLGGTSIQTVHNVVNDLTRAGLLRKIELENTHSAQYETRTGDNHHHAQCIRCGRVEDVDCTVGHAPCLTPAQTHGMRILEASLTFRGICTTCERNNT